VYKEEKRKEAKRKRMKLPKLPIPEKIRMRRKNRIDWGMAMSEEKESSPRKI